MTDTYFTIQGPSVGEYKEKGSKFLAYAFPVFSEEDWQIHLEEVKKLHPKARHHCFSWRLGLDGNNFRANDDGEPSGTAGRPILGQIDSFGLTNVLVVVVRYFGGTKLGVPGLIHAYKTSTADALGNAQKIEKTLEDIFRLNFDYSLMSQVMNATKFLKLEIVKQNFDQEAYIDIAIRQSEIASCMILLKAKIAGIHPEQAETLDKIEGLEINYLSTR